MAHRRRPGHHRSRTRCRWWDDDRQAWAVTARVERFVEALVLQLLADGTTHGYDMVQEIAAVAPEERIDSGNLYRLLRSLEEEGLVDSRWDDDLPGRARRTYRLTADGRDALAAWTDALRRANASIDRFLGRGGPSG